MIGQIRTLNHFPPVHILPFEYTCSCFIIVFYRNQKSDSGRTGPLDLVIKKFPLGDRTRLARRKAWEILNESKQIAVTMVPFRLLFASS